MAVIESVDLANGDAFCLLFLRGRHSSLYHLLPWSVSIVSHLEFPELRGLSMPASVTLTSGFFFFFFKPELSAVGCRAKATLQLVMVHCWRWEQLSRHWFQNRLKTTLQVFPTLLASSLVLLETTLGCILAPDSFLPLIWCGGV